ncbi:guanylate kinase [Mycoplasmoides fastidiosum]|uniref:Guanylate kinase n=1 Tax=Mycoplasmoides fastidiosum TaxID=92758 RepID=A0ABU0LZY5_9BACT|nr:guanylate kinase [Mycoplasmoides fastidiosum]MDQ0514269.1 guanylate kinase [Mycoplasmoides fastidiosum]UUD37323.1 guanylate kinase [Mycoplasmoides fastidiosum]
MKKGILFLISGPSGVGKKTILTDLFDDTSLNLHYSISMTTRPKRPNEIHGKDYYFVDKDFFLQEIEKHNMLEYAEFFNNFYGTPKPIVEKMLAEGKNVLLEIEVIGAQQIMELMPDCVTIFILPPSIDELKNRLIMRQTETIDLIEKRLEKARKEIKLQDIYQHKIYNFVATDAANELKKIIKAEILARK